MKRHEYIRIELDMGDLDQLNRFSEDGWRVAGIVPVPGDWQTDRLNLHWTTYALLERELPDVA